MIAKISATENLGGALGYNFKKVEKGDAEVILSKGLYQSAEGEFKMEEVLRDMQALLPQHCRTKKIVFHCSLNPHPDEHLSDERLATLAEEYMQALGYGSQPCIVFKHHDIEREHIHIVSLRVDSLGQKINDKFENRRSKRITDTLEQKYSLIPSTPNKGQKAQPLYIQKGQASDNLRNNIAQILREVLAHYRFCSLGEFNAVLSRYNLVVKEVKTTYRGKQYDGLVYLPTNAKSNPIYASKIGRGSGYTAIQHKIRQSKQSIKPFIAGVRQRVLGVMRTSPRNEEELLTRLEHNELRCLIRKNDKGRIYGITFIDDKAGIALNGSRLGKGYSANVFAQYLQNTEVNPFLDETRYHNNFGESAKEQAKTREFPFENAESDNLIDELLDNTLDTWIAPAGNDDWKEAAWQRKLRKQSKVRLPRRKH